MKTTAELRLYVLIRSDLPIAQKTVQACHAVSQLVIKNHNDLISSWGEIGPNLVLYNVPGKELNNYLKLPQGITAGFWEPDLGNLLTAIAYYGKTQNSFKGLKLV